MTKECAHILVERASVKQRRNSNVGERTEKKKKNKNKNKMLSWVRNKLYVLRRLSDRD